MRNCEEKEEDLSMNKYIKDKNTEKEKDTLSDFEIQLKDKN